MRMIALRRPPFSARAVDAERVVARALVLVFEDLVRGDELLELLLRVRRLVDVGMELSRAFLERSLDLLLRRLVRNSEHRVEVLALGHSHRFPSLCNTGRPKRRLSV